MRPIFSPRRVPRPDPRRQHGMMLLEVLIAILIFSLGVLAIVSLQATAAKDSAQSKYRADAILLANDLIGQMWAGNRNNAALAANFAKGGPGYDAWLANAKAQLPGLDEAVTNSQVVAVAGGAGGLPTSTVSIVVAWKAPNEAAAVGTHQVRVTTQISPP